MLSYHLREIDTSENTENVGYWVLRGKIRANIRSYFAKLISQINKSPDMVDIYAPQIAEITPEHVAIAISGYLEECHGHLSSVDRNTIVETVSCSTFHELFNALQASERLDDSTSLSENSFLEIKKFIPALNNKMLMNLFFDFNSTSVQYRVQSDGIHPFLVNKVLNKPSSHDHALMLMSGAGYTHNASDYLYYGDVAPNIRFNPFIAALKAKSKLPQSDTVVDLASEQYAENIIRHQHYEKDKAFSYSQKNIPLIIENVAFKMLKMALDDSPKSREFESLSTLYNLISSEMTSPIPLRVSATFKSKVSKIASAASFYSLNELVIDTLFSSVNPQRRHELHRINRGFDPFHESRRGLKQWLDLVHLTKPLYKQVTDYVDDLLNHISEHAHFLSVVQSEVNRIAGEYLAQGKFSQNDINSLCHLFESEVFSNLDTAFEVTSNKAVVDYLVECERRMSGCSVQFFKRFQLHMPRQMMADVLKGLGSDATESLILDYLSWSEQEIVTDVGLITDIRVAGMASLLSVAEQIAPGIFDRHSKKFDIEQMAEKAKLPKETTLQMYHRLINEPKKAALESIPEPEQSADMSFITNRFSL